MTKFHIRELFLREIRIQLNYCVYVGKSCKWRSGLKQVGMGGVTSQLNLLPNGVFPKILKESNEIENF